jgi:DNA gyrase subunit A
MTDPIRPDLSQASPEVRAYIEALETELSRLRAADGPADADALDAAPPFDPTEPPTTLSVITATAGALIKRTPRHLYDRQRRGGMGIFDLEVPAEDPPGGLAVVDEAHDVILLTSHARAFHWPVSRLAEAPVRGRGQPLAAELGLQPDETLAWVLPAGRGTGVALLSATGFVRVLPAHVVGQSMSPGTALYRAAAYGRLAAACWTGGQGDLFVATRRGMAIRFPERSLPVGGGAAIRLEAGDEAVGIESVRPPEGQAIFLLGADGRGTIRLMSGFAANKSAGGGGKLALKTDHLVAVIAVEPTDDIFAISRLSKIIRFRAGEVPAKEGVVQGVNCMSLRADEVMAVAASPSQRPGGEAG